MPRRRHIAAILFVLAFATACDHAPDPPEPEDWSNLEPLVTTQIEDRLEDVRIAPRDADAWSALAMAYHANRLIDLAAPCYERALELDAARARDWYGLARLRADLGDTEAALAAVDEVIARDDLAWFAHWRRGLWLIDAGRLDDAAIAFERASAGNSADPVPVVGEARVAGQRGDHERVVALLAPLLRSQNGLENVVYVRNLLGNAFRALGDEARAETLLAQRPVSATFWSDPWSRELRAHCRLEEAIVAQAGEMVRTGNPTAALAHLDQLLPARADDPTLLKMQGMAYFAMGDLERAVEPMRRAAARSPNDFAAHLNLGFACEGLGHWDEGIDATRDALVLRPTDMAARMQLGRLLVRAGHFDEAADVLHGVAGENAMAPDVFVWITQAHIGRRDIEKATQALGTARQLQPDHAELDVLQQMIESLGAGGAP